MAITVVRGEGGGEELDVRFSNALDRADLEGLARAAPGEGRGTRRASG